MPVVVASLCLVDAGIEPLPMEALQAGQGLTGTVSFPANCCNTRSVQRPARDFFIQDRNTCLKVLFRVTSTPSPQLRLHIEEQPPAPPLPDAGQVASLCQAFRDATGWEMEIEQSPPGLGEAWSMALEAFQQPASRLVLRPGVRSGAAKGKELAEVRPLARALAGVLNDMQRLRHEVWRREAELAAGVPVTRRRDDQQHLAARLEFVLKAGAEAVNCQAAGLYLLDEATTVLKLRAAWGLAEGCLLAPPRPLRGAIADLEALTGNAVVLEDTTLLPHWRCPEDFPAAACVPVSSPSVPLGTLWVFCDATRDFSDQETNLLEIIAGRLAADLEREMLLATGQQATELDKQVAAAAQWMSDRLPTITPLVDGYEIAGWTRQAQDVGGDFHDWSVHSDGRLALTVGDAHGNGLAASLTAAALRASLTAHAAYAPTAGKLLTTVNESLLARSPGDEQASLAFALVDPNSGAAQIALAGEVAALLVGPHERSATTTDAPAIGTTADYRYSADEIKLRPGQVLAVVSSGVLKAVDPAGLRIGEAALTAMIARHLCDSARELVARFRRLLEHPAQVPEDMTVLIVKRRG